MLRIKDQNKNRINSDMTLVVVSEESRSQHQNRANCVARIQDIIDEAFVEPKVRVIQTTLPEKTKEKYKEFKLHRKAVIQNRGKIRSKDFTYF